jgi:hypothetical protein
MCLPGSVEIRQFAARHAASRRATFADSESPCARTAMMRLEHQPLRQRRESAVLFVGRGTLVELQNG